MLQQIGSLMPIAANMTPAELSELSQLFFILAIVAFSIAVLAIAGSVVIWIKLDIKNVIGFLSGKNAEKAIEALLTGKQAYRGKSKAERPSEPVRRPSAGANAYAGSAEATMPLDDGERTELLSKNARAAPRGARNSDATELLSGSRGEETELLGSNAAPEKTAILYGSEQPCQSAAPGSPPQQYERGFRCDSTQILTGVWDEEIEIDLDD